MAAREKRRKLVKFDLTRADIPPLEGFDPMPETPPFATVNGEDLRIEHKGDGVRFMRAVIFAVQCIEKANPGQVAIMTDPELKDAGNVSALTVTVLP